MGHIIRANEGGLVIRGFAIRRFSCGLNNLNVNIEMAYDIYVASTHVVFKCYNK